MVPFFLCEEALFECLQKFHIFEEKCFYKVIHEKSLLYTEKVFYSSVYIKEL